MNQIKYFYQDINKLLGRNKWRIVIVFFYRSFWGVFIYRFERLLYLLLGRPYKALRILLLPIYSILYWYSNSEIHYQADIKGGISILHSSLGVVVSGRSKIGKNLTLIGGNCIGVQANKGGADFILGDNLTLGVNSTIIGPITLGNNIKVGASACVSKSFTESNITLVGVPAKKLC